MTINYRLSFSGRYIFFETSYPAKAGDVACFYSSQIPPASCQRLTFWYHMYGAQMGTLKVLKKANGSTTTLWKRSFQQGMNWLQASVVISSKASFQVQKYRKRNCFEITPLFRFWLSGRDDSNFTNNQYFTGSLRNIYGIRVPSD